MGEGGLGRRGGTVGGGKGGRFSVGEGREAGGLQKGHVGGEPWVGRIEAQGLGIGGACLWQGEKETEGKGGGEQAGVVPGEAQGIVFPQECIAEKRTPGAFRSRGRGGD